MDECSLDATIFVFVFGHPCLVIGWITLNLLQVVYITQHCEFPFVEVKLRSCT